MKEILEIMKQNTDFSKGSVSKNIIQLAIPMTFAQLIHLLYSVVDRMYIGRIPNAAANALTGIGLTFPIISIITAFASLFGSGGAPLFSIARGADDNKHAGEIMANTFTLLLSSGGILTILILLFKKPLLYLFGASDATFPYANNYMSIYICGSIFAMLSIGLNNFINAQGFGRKGMMTILLGAVINIILDPIFIFIFNMGVQGAALATIIAQFVSALWAVGFLSTKKSPIRLEWDKMRLDFAIVKNITALGVSGFIMAITNSLVQIVCNTSLANFGGDLYIGVMTIINSIREIVMTPINGLTNATQPILGFNYGAKQYKRVCTGIKFSSIICVIYSLLAWMYLLINPMLFIKLFSNDTALINATIPSMHIYFFGIFMMSLQMSGQTAAVALGRSKQAVFFSLLRKAFIVVPLTLILPYIFNLGVNGVFLAEPISNFLGGAACFITMMLTIWKDLRNLEHTADVPQTN